MIIRNIESERLRERKKEREREREKGRNKEKKSYFTDVRTHART